MSNESDIFEQIKLYLPKYLTPTQTEDLYEELKKFPDFTTYYWDSDEFREQLLQGDGWRGFVVIDFGTGDRKSVSGMIVSNSCDIAMENARYYPVNILFAPLIKLEGYLDRLREAGRTNTQIESVAGNIRKQRCTNIFYLPGCPGSLQESMILLDDIHAHPLQDFLGRERLSLFTLSQPAFYIFLLKLSIHLCRFREDVRRFSQAV